MKHFIFNHLLPKSLKRNIIFRKTGKLLLKDIRVSDKIIFDYVIPPNNSFWIDRLSKPYGHEPLVVQFYENHLRKEDVVFDIGAQMGYFPSVLTALQSTAEVHAFEGSWFAYNYLTENKKLNDKHNKWKLNLVFVADKNGIIEGVKSITLDSYCAVNKIKPSILQMDVDGEEFRIMNGAKQLLENNFTEFLIEVHPKDLKERNINLDDFLSLFKRENLGIFYLPDFRLINTKWTEDFETVNKNEEFYIYVFPLIKKRF
jgi:hypothetical protein